ncbi:hypothetical protein BKA63DRAFT_524855 [Paraphoma chrysanthemicola]|nr:hypothetical protein BKA63DRAFT_524855 [Paraphoma chrysanthemicola]
MSPSANAAPQMPCSFFKLPLELRQAIYGYLVPYGVHLNLRPDIFSLSVCVQPRPNDSFYGGERRWVDYPRGPEPIYPRRLRSSWGHHWECEEIALGTNHTVEALRDSSMDFMLTCKKMRADAMDFIIDVATCHVTDLITLQFLLQSPTTLTTETWAASFKRIQVLSITLRLSLHTFAQIEQDTLNDSQDNDTTSPNWLTLCPALRKLHNLRILHIWADHTSPKTWTLVNERAFLHPLEALSTSPNLDITANLPKLHPRYESPDRHYMQTTPAPPFTITRRLRQSEHAVQVKGGEFRVKSAQDFPILFEDDSDEDLEEVERRERRMWERGEDVEAKANAISPWMHVFREPLREGVDGGLGIDEEDWE